MRAELGAGVGLGRGSATFWQCHERCPQPGRAADISLGTNASAGAFSFPSWRCDVRAGVCRDGRGAARAPPGLQTGEGSGALLSAPPGPSAVAGIVPFPYRPTTDVLSCF